MECGIGAAGPARVSGKRWTQPECWSRVYFVASPSMSSEWLFQPHFVRRAFCFALNVDRPGPALLVVEVKQNRCGAFAGRMAFQKCHHQEHHRAVLWRPLVLDHVYFVNCVFAFSQAPKTRQLPDVILASAPTTFKAAS